MGGGFTEGSESLQHVEYGKEIIDINHGIGKLVCHRGLSRFDGLTGTV